MNKKIIAVIGFLIVVICNLYLIHFTNRTDHFKLLGVSCFSWIGTILLFLFAKEKEVKKYLIVGFVFQLGILTSQPKRSDDFYRFIWDGEEVAQLNNPYLKLPSELIKTEEASELQKEVYDDLNSPNYYAVYPPFNQFIFGFSNLLSNKSININLLIYRIIFILFEVLLLLSLFQLVSNKKLILLLFFNTFWWVELLGNIHFELIELSLFVISVFLIKKKKITFSALIIGLSIATKFHILIIAPFLLQTIPKKHWINWIEIAAISFAFWFLLFPSLDGYANMLESIKLFIQTFEFNASVFYLVKYIGFESVGYDIIKTAGPTLSVTTFLALGYLLFKAFKTPKRALDFALYGYTIYLLLSSVVHPWYLAPLIVLGALTNHFYPFIWAACSILSYTAYNETEVMESPLFLSLEYLTLFTAIGLEFWIRKKPNYFEKSIFKSLYHS